MSKATSNKVNNDKNLEKVLADIEKQFGKGAVMRLGDNPHMKMDVVQCFKLKRILNRAQRCVKLLLLLFIIKAKPVVKRPSQAIRQRKSAEKLSLILCRGNRSKAWIFSC